MKHAAFILPLAFWPLETVADTFCDRLHKGDATLGMSEGVCTESSVLEGPDQTTCYWSYEYRSPLAYERIEALRIDIEMCLGEESVLPSDQPVNHPDSFLLYRYEGQGHRASVSLKDKAALQQTLIFVSLSATP